MHLESSKHTTQRQPHNLIATSTHQQAKTLAPSINTMLHPLLPESQTSLLPSLTRALPNLITSLTIIQHPRLREDVALGIVVNVAVIILRITLEERKDVLHTKLSDCLAALDRRLRELALRFLQCEDALFDGIVDGEAVHGYVDGLVEAVDSVDGLLFDELNIVSTLARDIVMGRLWKVI